MASGTVDHRRGISKFVDEVGNGLEVIEPRNIREVIIRRAHGTVKENHRECRIQDLLVIDILTQCLAQLRDRFVAVAHDVVIDLLTYEPLGAFQMDCGHTETAMQVALIRLESAQDRMSARRPPLMRIENGKDQTQNVVDEMVK